MVVRSLFTGVSGLQAHFDKMDTLSNNISNLNTAGFKKSNVVFKSFLSQQTATATAPTENRGGTNPQSVGLGTQVGSVNLDMSQGQVQRTGVNTDLAIQGEGFFTAREAGTSNNLYTRAGSFEFDSQGRLVDPSNGNVVQGYNAEVEGGEIQELVSQGQPGDVQVTQGMESIPGSATTFQEIAGNLNADAETGIDPVTVNYGSGEDQSAARFEFERYNPTENQYRFNAVWTENPPSGKQTGDTVTDQVTGRNMEGIMELNDEGQVTGLFRNPDTNFNNGIEQVEADRNNANDYTIDSNGLSVRDQANVFSDLTGQNWNDEMRVQFSNDTGDYNVQWQDQNGNWNDMLTDPGVAINHANDAGGGGSAANEIQVADASAFSEGDTVRVFDETDDESELATIDSVDTGTDVLTLQGDLANQYETGNTLEITRSFTGNVGNNERLVRDVEDNPTATNVRDGELKIDSSLIDGTSTSDGDSIYFSIAQADNTGVLNQSGESLKEEFRWGGQEGRFRVSSPESGSENTSGASLQRVFNYDESNIGNINNSSAFNDVPNKEFSVYFSDDSTYHVGADTQGTKGNSGGLATDEGPGDTTLDVNDTSNYAVGDMIKIQDSAAGNEEALVVEQIDSGAGTIEVSPVADGNDDPGATNGPQNNYAAADTTITNLGTVMTDEGGNLSFSTNEDENLFVDTNPTVDDGSGNDSFSNPGELSEVGVSIAAGNWSTNTVGQGEEFEFTATEARSQNSGRGFGVVKSGNGESSALFMPSGTPDQPSSISFAPNQTDTSGILSDLQTTGSSATAEQKDPSTVQTVASSDVFDSLGQQHTVNYTFEKKNDSTWMWSAEDPTPVNPGDPDLAGFGTLTFNENGQLENSQNFAPKTAEDLPPPGPGGDLEQSGIYFNPPSETLQSDPEASDNLNPDVGSSPVNISPDFSGLTQFSGESNTEIAGQDGTSQGSLTSLSFDQTGILQGSYDNGERRQLAQLSIANFQNAEGLSKEGSTYFSETANSGIPQFATAGSGGRGTITPGALERSNVELSAQFTQVISTQRGFQANTRTITTSDQMVQSVLQLI